MGLHAAAKFDGIRLHTVNIVSFSIAYCLLHSCIALRNLKQQLHETSLTATHVKLMNVWPIICLHTASDKQLHSDRTWYLQNCGKGGVMRHQR